MITVFFSQVMWLLLCNSYRNTHNIQRESHKKCTRRRAELKTHKLFVSVFAPNELGEKSNQHVHLGDTNMEEEGSRICALHTWTVIKVQQVLKPLLYHIRMWGPSPRSCIYFCLLVCWLETLMVLFIVQPLLYFLSLSVRLCLFTISYSLISLTEVRSEERGMLERAGVVQSFTVGVAPIVVVISSVCTFTLHMALGYDLTAAEVFKYGNLYSPYSLHFSIWIHLPSLETPLLCWC